MTYSSIKFEVVAKIGELYTDVVQCTCSYELNRIPKATLVLPVGRETSTMILANSHFIAGNTELQLPAQIYVNVLKGAGLGNAHAIVPVGTYMLFDGYVTGVGYRRKRSGMSIAVELTHWLSDLNFSSTLSASSHPGNPYSLTFNAKISSPADVALGGAAGGKGAAGHWTGKTMAQDLLEREDVLSDLWGNAILQWFLGLTESDRLLFQHEAFGVDDKLNDSKNKEAQKALKRFSGTRLKIDAPDTEESLIVRAILEDIAVTNNNGANSSAHFTAIANTTLWNKLVGDLGQRYMFSVIPYPDTAKVVPFIAGIRDVHNPRDETYSIMGRDISSMDLNTHLPRPLRAVGIFGGHSDLSGFYSLGGSVEVDLKDVSGMYIGRDEGLVMYKMAPRWATEIGINWATSLTTLGIGIARASAFDPGVGTPRRTDENLKAAREHFSTVLDKYAQAMYAQEVLKNRVGQVSGPVRFDIAPGSNVSIEGQRDTFSESGTVDVRYGTVIRVTHYFDAEAPSAGTGFQIGHIRNAAENESNSTSIEKHPLYEDKWIGSELVEEES